MYAGWDDYINMNSGEKLSPGKDRLSLPGVWGGGWQRKCELKVGKGHYKVIYSSDKTDLNRSYVFGFVFP